MASQQQQQPSRPWFRLASLARFNPPPPAPAPTLAPAPTFVRPAIPQTIRLSGPTQETTQPPSALSTKPPTPELSPKATGTTASLPTTPVLRTSIPVPTIRTPPIARPPVVDAQPPRSPPLPAVAIRTPPLITRPADSAPPKPSSPPPATTVLPVAYSSLAPSPKPKASSPPPAPPVVTQPSPKRLSPPRAMERKSPPPPPPVLTYPSPKGLSPTATQIKSPPPPPPVLTYPSPKRLSPPATQRKSASPMPQFDPETRRFTHPPSPLILPPAQMKSDVDQESRMPMEPEQKKVLVQEIKETLPPRMIPNGDQKTHAGNANHYDKGKQNDKSSKLEKGIPHKKPLNPEEYGVKVITIAGENKGAIMELSPSRNRRHEFGNNPRTLRGDEASKASSGEEGRSGNPRAIAGQPKPVSAFMNSNVQGVNNSILYNCSCTHNDPGVHLSLSRKARHGEHTAVSLEEKSH